MSPPRELLQTSASALSPRSMQKLKVTAVLGQVGLV